MKFIDPNYLCDDLIKYHRFDWLLMILFYLIWILFCFNKIRSNHYESIFLVQFSSFTDHFISSELLNEIIWYFPDFIEKNKNWWHFLSWSNSLHFHSWFNSLHFQSFCVFIINHSSFDEMFWLQMNIDSILSQWQSISSFLQLESFGDIIKLFSLSFVHHFVFKFFKWRWCVCVVSFPPFQVFSSLFPFFCFSSFSFLSFLSFSCSLFSFWPFLQFLFCNYFPL